MKRGLWGDVKIHPGPKPHGYKYSHAWNPLSFHRYRHPMKGYGLSVLESEKESFGLEKTSL